MIINTNVLGRNIFNYLKLYHIGDNYHVKDHVIQTAMADLILDLVWVAIYDSTETLTHRRYSVRITEAEAFNTFVEKTGLNLQVSKNIILDSYPVETFLEEVYSFILSKGKYGTFGVCNQYIEYTGDYRIQQWENEHLDENGKYKE